MVVCAVVFYAFQAVAASPAKVSLEDYAFDFPKYRHKITVPRIVGDISDRLASDDIHITIYDKGYGLKTFGDELLVS